MPTNGDDLRAHADRLGIPPRTLDQVSSALNEAAKRKADMSMARLMLNHGRLTVEARTFVESWVAERSK